MSLIELKQKVDEALKVCAPETEVYIQLTEMTRAFSAERCVVDDDYDVVIHCDPWAV